MTEQSKGMTRPVKKRLNDEAFNKLIKTTVHTSVKNGFVAKCYCRRCGNIWDMRARGIKMLEKESPNNLLELPEGVKNLHNEEELKKCFFVIEPCFFCRYNGEKIKTEVKLIPKR